jgi:selenocysteine lyase/cysteine desulfurase
VPGIAGLGAGISFLAETGMDAVEAKEKALIQKLVKGLDSIAGVHLYGPGAGTVRGSVVSFTMKDQEPMMISLLLDQIFDIAVRAGLHCAPDAHALCGTLGTGGMVRVSPGFFTTEEEIDVFLDAVESL